MSSVIRVMDSHKFKASNKFDNLSTPCYYDNDLDENVPVPFTAVNGVLDIEKTNTSVENFIANGSSPDDDTEYQAKLLGGIRPIHTLGPNMLTYLRNRISNHEGDLSGAYTGAIEIYVAPVMTKAQLAQPGNVQGLTFENIYGVNDNAPTSDEYVGGTDSNKYYASWVFKTPLTIKYRSLTSTTGYRYMTFSTHYDGD